MDAHEIRSAYLRYYADRGHAQIPRANLMPVGDKTTLFTSAGMQPLLPYLLGTPHPDGTRLVDVQPCIRSQDIDDVGDNRHTTFFEMLGNWSLGDYFKDEQIPWFFSFLVDVVGLDPQRLYVSCFIGDPANGIPRDDESAAIWQRVFAERGIDAQIAEVGSHEDGDRRGIRPGERIFFYDSNENWWSRGGNLDDTPLGDPCGPDSEVFYDFGPDFHDASYGKPHPASDSGRFMEIGNQVFTQYRREQDGTFSLLEERNVDFGGGLERIAAASEGTPDVYRVSLLWPIIEVIERLSGKSYADDPEPMRIVADHIRGAVFLATDGDRPSNKEQGYVLRRILRRAISTGRRLGLDRQFFAPLIDVVIDDYADAYPELAEQRDDVLAALLKEEKSFRGTLERGIKQLGRYEGKTLTGADLFYLSDTRGLPRDIAVEEAGHMGIEVSPTWEDDFQAALHEQQERSRAGR